MTNIRLRIGIDLGGTKIAGIAVDADGAQIVERRVATPRGDYQKTVSEIVKLVYAIEEEAGQEGTIGIGIPGSISPATGKVQNGNSTWLNGQALDKDLEAQLSRPIRIANDANCFALSEAVDGAGAGSKSVLGVILGTGCGSGLVVNGQLINGPRGIGGEWGHNPLPWPVPDEIEGPQCWCGRRGCMEVWVSGPALAADFERQTGKNLKAEDIVLLSEDGDLEARASLQRHASRLARGLACVVNVFDPHVIVLGGGLSKLDHLYKDLPELIKPHIFADNADVVIRPPVHGDDSGVRGAAWLWNHDV